MKTNRITHDSTGQHDSYELSRPPVGRLIARDDLCLRWSLLRSAKAPTDLCRDSGSRQRPEDVAQEHHVENLVLLAAS